MSVAHHLTRIARLAIGFVAGFVAIGWAHPAQGAAMIVVNTLADEDINNGSCSLREAIVAANTNVSYNGCAAVGAGVNDEIKFDLGGGTPTINIGGTPLPAITEWVTIDGGNGRVVLHGPGGPPVSGNHGLTVTRDGFGTIIRNLVINNFSDDGIRIEGDEVWVFGCFIGTDATGTTAVPNQGFGIQVFAGNGARIGGATSGGSCTGDCNVISGAINSKADVLLDVDSMGAMVRGNFIGTDVTGTAAIGGGPINGILDKGHDNRIGGMGNTTPGGACTGDCNLISGNNGNGGVFIDQAASGSIVQGNFIGTDVTGAGAVSSAFAIGIVSRTTGAMIGGTTPAARNIVSGNRDRGIEVRGFNTTVQGNYIGTDSAGTAAVPGSGTGVRVFQANGTIVGGTGPGAGNLISGAFEGTHHGVSIEQSTNTHVVGNLIGTAADGTTPVPNLFDGVSIFDQAAGNVIGGPMGAANVIAFNRRNGVLVDGQFPQVRSNAIRGNSIHSNGALGISLIENGNDQLAPPTIDGIDPLHGTTCAACTVEIFSDSEDEGRLFEGSVFTNDGNWTFNGTLTGPHVTATNTDMGNNTSGFSTPFVLATATPTESPSPSFSPTVATATATSTGTLAATSTQTHTATPADTRTATSATTATPTRTVTATATASTATATSTAARSDTTTPSATATALPCRGDCNGDGVVAINDLITGVNIGRGALPLSACPAFANAQGEVDIAQLIKGVRNALNGCSA